MPRISRMVVTGEQAVYHVMSRTALDGLPFGDIEKDFFVKLLKKLDKLYLADVIGFCVMGNHFHLLVRMLPDTDFTDKDIKERYIRYYGDDTSFSNGQIPYYRNKWSSLSEFIREIKLGFSRFYNKRHNRRGFLWGDRFKSVIVEDGETLINCLAYIDLNPVRAGIVERPEEYRWSSIGYHVQADNKDGFLCLDFGLTEFGVLKAKERLRRYRRYLYETGASAKNKSVKIKQDVLNKERKKEYRITRSHRFRYRTRYFSDSGIIGSREFVQNQYDRFKNIFQSKNPKIPKLISGLDGIYSLKRLSE